MVITCIGNPNVGDWLSNHPTIYVPTSKKNCLYVYYIFFVDDNLLFCNASTSWEWRRLTKLLKIYEKASWQKLNMDKTSIFFNRTISMEDIDQILNIYGIQATQRYEMYLGLTALVGKSKTWAFRNIKDRFWKRLHNWKMKFLLQAEKEILL